jgi:hypothetical protein
MQKTRIFSGKIILLLLSACLFYCLGTRAQGLDKIKEASKTISEPLKQAQGAQTTISQGAETISKAPEQITKNLESAKNSIDEMKKSLGGATPKPGDNASKNPQTATPGSTSANGKGTDAKTPTATQGGGYAPNNNKSTPLIATKAPQVDPTDVPRPVPPGSKDNKTPSGPMPVEILRNSSETSGATDVYDDGQIDATVRTRLNIAGTNWGTSDYSNSPARILLEKADFDIQTLEDLYRYSGWQNPEREHTIRAVQYALEELHRSIMEIKKLDPMRSTWKLEERYREMYAIYQAEKGKTPIPTSAVEESGLR